MLLKLQLPAGAGGALLADPSNPGSLLLLPDSEGDDAEPEASPAHWHADGESDGWPDAMRLRGSKLGGLGVKVLGPAAAAELQPMPLRRLVGYSLMDVKKTYLMTGLMEEALGIIRWGLGGGSGGAARPQRRNCLGSPGPRQAGKGAEGGMNPPCRR